MTIHEINAVLLKEKVATSLDFTSKERDFILDSINARVAVPRAAVAHTPRNYLGRIDHVWLALSVDDGGEGVVAAPIGPGGMTMPLVAADGQRLEIINPIVRALAVKFKMVIRIAKFTVREDVQIYRP